jgi:DNA-binding SARP family transcriptional activator/WD40 repeat protein
MDIAVLGPVRVDGDAQALSPRDRVVLAALAVRPNAPVRHDELAEALWGAQPPASSTKVVQGCVSRLRRVLGVDAITTHDAAYQLTVPSEWLDANRFERQLRRAEQLLALDQPDRAAHTLDAALTLWRGEPLGELDGWDPARIERERLAELRRDAQECLLDAQLRAGRHGEVVGEAHRLVDAAPLRERRWALLARALYQAGRQTDALQALHRARVLLSTELGLDPGPELTELQERILRHDEALAASSATEVSTTCPYRGLVPFDVADADEFFGRADDVDACMRRLGDGGAVVVVGPSGSGKSSVVRAGIAARLRRDGRQVTVVTPGARPMDALTALPGRPGVLVVDQCEEVAALCDDPDEQAAFLDALVAHADRGGVVVALRADWLGDLSGHAGFARTAERGLHLLAPMGPEQLRAAITEPAAMAGLLIEPGLVDLLVSEVSDEPGALPLLSHALRTTWERREGRTLTVAGYTAAGGIRDAVAQTAEAAYERVPAEHRPLLRDLLLRMVAQSDEGAPVRARVSRELLTDDRAHADLVELLVAERLVTSDGERVELAHEAVIRAWPRLRAWLDEDVIGQRILRHLSLAAATWEQMGRPDSELYRGVRLAQAVEWRDRADPHLTAAERAFHDASVALADAERRDVEERAAQQARSNRRLRMLLAGVGVLALVAVVAGVVAVRQADRAGTAARSADARRVGAQALAGEDIDTALLLAVEGVRLDDSPDTRANLLETLGRSPDLVEVIRGEGDGAFSRVSISPDGETVAVHDDGNRLTFYDAASGDVRATIQGDVPVAGDVVTGGATFHPDNGPIAAAFFAGTLPRSVLLLDPVTFERLPRQLEGFPPQDLIPWGVTYSHDGTLLAAAFDDFGGNATVGSSRVMVWDMADVAAPPRVLDVPRFTHSVAFGPDGRELYTGVHVTPASPDIAPEIVVHDLAAGTVARTLSVPSHPFVLSMDGAMIAAADDGRGTGTDVVLVDARTGAVTERLRGHADTVLDLAFSSDGAQVASSSADGSVILWDVTSGTAVRQLQGHASAVPSVVFDPASDTVVSAGADRLLLRWDPSGRSRFTPARASTAAPGVDPPFSQLVARGIVSPDGTRVAYLHHELNAAETPAVIVEVLDVGRGRLGPPIALRHGQFAALAWHPDGGSFVTTGGDGFIRVWDAASGRLVRESQFGVSARDVAYVGTAGIVVMGSGGIVVQLDARSLEQSAPLFGLDVPADQAGDTGGGHRFDFDSGALAAARGARTAALVVEHDVTRDDDATTRDIGVATDRLIVVDLDAPDERTEVDLGFDAERLAVSPDGRRVAVTGRRGQVALVDAASGELLRRPVSGHDGPVASIAYSRDGGTIATGGDDGRVSVWDGESGGLLSSTVVGRAGAAVYVGFEPDLTTVVAANGDGDVFEFDTRVQHWIDVACSVAGRNLTETEWRETFGDLPYRPTCPARG